MTQQRHLITDAIILKTTPSGEINKNFTFLSPNLGITNAIAFGGLKIKSRFCSSVQPYVNATLFLYKSPKYSFYKLEDISTVQTNDFIKKDLKFIYLVSFFYDILLNTYITDDEYKSFYFLMLYTIEIIKEKNDIKKAFLFFTCKFFFLSGYSFYLANCKTCKNQFDNYFFNPIEGSIFCSVHAKNKIFVLKNTTSLLWSQFINEKFIYLKEKVINDKEFYSLLPIIILLLKQIFERELKTFNYINEIFF